MPFSVPNSSGTRLQLGLEIFAAGGLPDVLGRVVALVKHLAEESLEADFRATAVDLPGGQVAGGIQRQQGVAARAQGDLWRGRPACVCHGSRDACTTHGGRDACATKVERKQVALAGHVVEVNDAVLAEAQDRFVAAGGQNLADRAAVRLELMDHLQLPRTVGVDGRPDRHLALRIADRQRHVA